MASQVVFCAGLTLELFIVPAWLVPLSPLFDFVRTKERRACCNLFGRHADFEIFIVCFLASSGDLRRVSQSTTLNYSSGNESSLRFCNCAAMRTEFCLKLPEYVCCWLFAGTIAPITCRNRNFTLAVSGVLSCLHSLLVYPGPMADPTPKIKIVGTHNVEKSRDEQLNCRLHPVYCR